MRYIGGKSLLLEEIQNLIDTRTEGVTSVADLFTGSGVVAAHFKANGYKVISNDILYMSYCLARGMTELNSKPRFSGLGFDAIEYLNSISNEPSEDDSECFIYQNYSPHDACSRMYFQNGNALKIDRIRLQIEKWHQEEKLSEAEYYYLIACLLSAAPYVANITGVYAAYLKHWDKRTYNDLELKPLPVINSRKKCVSYNMDAAEVSKHVKFDLAYIDTPYNSRQYAPNYHILETIARYDYPEIHGVSGVRDYERSDFCSKAKVAEAFHNLMRSLRCRYAVVSYNNEGLLSTNELMDIFGSFGEVSLSEFSYRRYKSKIPNDTEGLKEQLYLIEFSRH